jgi:hypothetical protein
VIQTFVSLELCNKAADAIKNEITTQIGGSRRVQTPGRAVCVLRKVSGGRTDCFALLGARHQVVAQIHYVRQPLAGRFNLLTAAVSAIRGAASIDLAFARLAVVHSAIKNGLQPAIGKL